MAELSNCPNCGALFVKNRFRDVCDVCYKEEEKQYDTVYNYIRKRENRTATMLDVVEDTGVPETKIYKFIKTGRIKLAQFPNLGYPCQKCGTLIREGKLCNNCKGDLQGQLEELQKEREIRERNQSDREHTYYVFKDNKEKR
ncbi:hypothetical protein EJF36_18120 [Bacillus sp. HMF5848]|uniref:TIGR03826 family flagellar region protein n=1 Tax=Bacillus sp. HMF5848 TaxID=2495421 RepID=UPI000F76EA4E|nr:TIGR03826 family flagellar region protein [Bacillus sp. HMF5848]RSK28627.1 hypothetical protein EJF36_18120 [Bacillus sp. HMF5848]